MRKRLTILLLAVLCAGMGRAQIWPQPNGYVIGVWSATNQTLFTNAYSTNAQNVGQPFSTGGIPTNTIPPISTNNPTSVTNLNLIGQKNVSFFAEFVAGMWTNLGLNGVAYMTNALLTNIVGDGLAGYSGDGGQGSNAMLNWPVAVCFDLNSNLYVSDFGNNRVRKVTLAGIISTFAGTGVQGYSGDGGQATNAQLNGPWGLVCDTASNIYIADSGNSRIRMVSGTNGVITTYAGTNTAGYSGDAGAAVNAKLNGPTGLAIDGPSNNIFIADTLNSRVRRVGTNGIITNMAGTNVIGYTGDGGAAVNAELNGPMGVAVVSVTNLFIADTTNGRVRLVTNGVIQTFAGTNATGFSGDGSAAKNAKLNMPVGLLVNTINSNLFIADVYNGRIRAVTNSTGAIQTIAGGGTMLTNGTATNAQLNFPFGIAYDVNTNLYITSAGTNWVPVLGTGNLTLQFQVSADYEIWNRIGQASNALWISDPNYILTIPMTSNSTASATAWTNIGWTNFNSQGWERIRLGPMQNTASNFVATSLWLWYMYK